MQRMAPASPRDRASLCKAAEVGSAAQEQNARPQGDHNLSFSNVDAPFLFKNEGSHPYSGVLKIVDLNNSKNYAILSANSDAKTYRHEGYANGQLVSNFTNQWDVLDYN